VQIKNVKIVHQKFLKTADKIGNGLKNSGSAMNVDVDLIYTYGIKTGTISGSFTVNLIADVVLGMIYRNAARGGY